MKLSEMFKVKSEQTQLIAKENYNVTPGQFMPVVIADEIKRHLVSMKWGLIPFWAKDIKIGYKLINAKAETIFEKPMWKSAVLHHRCLVPANGFYEWRVKDDGTKVPFFIKPKYADLFSFAGIYSTWKDVEGKELQSFSILTTEPNKEMAPIHDRAPVILTQSEETNWLNHLNNDHQDRLEKLLHPYHDGGLEIYKVSTDVNSPLINDKHLISALA